MSDVLEQDEIDALLNGVQSGVVDTSPRAAGEAGEATRYDFSTQARIVRGKMPTLDMINERLARALRLSIFGMLKRSPEISVLGVTTQKYGDYVPTLAVPTSLNLIRLQPLAGTGVMVFEAKLVYALIDAYFGGNGRHTKIEGRDFTATENHIIQMVLDQVIGGVEEAWAPVLPVKVEYLSRESNPHFANLASATELVVVSRLRIDFDGRGGEFHITLPFAMLEPLKDTLRAGMQSDRADREERWSQLLRNELEDSEVELVTRLGSIHMTVGSLIDMRPGDIIPLDFDGHATVLSDGVPLFSGDLGQQRGMQVVRVNEMKQRKSGNSLDAFMRKSQ
jgi:flagellar motor switch protein FliM